MRITAGHLRRLIKEELKRALNENDEPEQSVVDIIDSTDPAYLKKTFDTRNPGSAIQAGSVFSEPQTAESLKAAEWSKLSTSAVKSPAIAFTAKIPGVLGYVPIDKLPSDMPVRFQLSHGGKGGKSGKATEVVAAFSTDAAKVDNTTLIAGPNEKGDKYVVWTFHPGDPAPMSDEITIDTVKDKFPELRGTMADAKALGFNFVKRVERLEESRGHNIRNSDVFTTSAYLDDGTPVCEACLYEELNEADETYGAFGLLEEAEYKGRKVQLGKPMKGDVKKFKVYVRDPKTGNIKKVNFGDPNMEIKRDDPKRRKSFRARHGCGTSRASDRTKPAWWSCRMWSTKPVSKILRGK